MSYRDFSVMMTEIAKRPRSLSDDSPSFGQMGQPSPKLPKTSHSSIPAATPSSPAPPQAQINYLARRCPENLRMINVDDSLPAIIRLIGEYDSILHRNESIAGNLGICTVGPMLVERFERMFDGPPKVLKSHGPEGTSVSWLDVVEFAKTKPDEFKLDKTRNGVPICQIDTKQCRIEISAEDFKLIKNGFGNIVLPQPILEDEEQELGTLGILEKRLSHIIQLADQVSAQAQQLSHSLKNRRNAINARRQHDINMQAHSQLQQADPAATASAAAAAAAAGRLTKPNSWLGQVNNGASSYPLTPGVEPPSALSNDAGVFPGLNRQPLPGHRPGSRGEAAPPFDARKADQHLDNILSATTFFPSGTVPENVTIINGTNIRSASPSTRSEMMRRFLSANQMATAAATTTADRPDGLANHRDGINRSTEEESKSYRPLMTSAAPRGGDELRVLPGHPGRQPPPPPPPPPHQLPHHHHGQPRGTEPDVSKPITEYASIQSFAPPTTGPAAQKSHAVVPIANAPTFHPQHTGPSTTSRTSSSKSPPRAGPPSSKSHGQSQPRDDGGPFKIQMISRMEGLRRGERILPPCDRCRRLGMECLKNLTACVGCTKKHAKCSWKDVKLEELQDTRPREVLSMIAGRTDLPPITFHQDRRSAQPSGRSQKSERKKRESPAAKAPSQSGGKSPQSAPTLAQPSSGDADSNHQPSLALRSPPLPSQHPQEASTTSMAAPTVPRASSIPAATTAHGNIAPEAMIHTRQRELSLPSPSPSSSARPHSMSANTGYSTLAGYHAHAGSPSSASSALPVYTAPPTTSNNAQSTQFLSPDPPASSQQQQQQQQQQQRPQFPPLSRYQSEPQRPSLSQYPMRSPDQNNRNEHSITVGNHAARRNSTREYDNSRTRENVRRLEKDPLSLAISDTIAQHMAARAAAEANAAASASASGRRDSVSAASASAASAASASPGRTAMTPLSAAAGPGPTPNKSSLVTIDEGGSKGAAAGAASSLGPMLSPSSGPAEAKRAPSPLDVIANDSARYEWAREQTKENERERQWGEAGGAGHRNARHESDGDVEMGNAS